MAVRVNCEARRWGLSIVVLPSDPYGHHWGTSQLNLSVVEISLSPGAVLVGWMCMCYADLCFVVCALLILLMVLPGLYCLLF